MWTKGSISREKAEGVRAPSTLFASCHQGTSSKKTLPKAAPAFLEQAFIGHPLCAALKITAGTR